MARKAAAEEPDYSVPALDKAFDILELLASQKGGMTLGQVSEAVGRSVHQIYRVLQVLEKRGYVHRGRPSGMYHLSLRLFELAHRHEPLRGLVEVALPHMRRLAEDIQQSCNLGIHNAGKVLVATQVESPAAFGFRVRVGAEFPLTETATGLTLLAFQPDETAKRWMTSAGLSGDEIAIKHAALADIRSKGHEELADGMQPGVIDLVFPILGHYGEAIAALTVPYVATTYSGRGLTSVRAATETAARDIMAGLATGRKEAS